ncbi:MAG: 6-pyruvoyl tetrahydropterin synthase family protein [Dehalococcoidia bacterium]
MSHKITLQRNRLRFSAAHFTTFGGECEPLHGHNYEVFVEIEGALTADSWVLDFGDVKDLVAALCGELDHKFLLAIRNGALDVTSSDGECEISFGERRYVMPQTDVVELDIDNSTAERLAEWFAVRIRDALADRGTENVSGVTVGVEESPGQAGWFSLEVRGG